MRTSHTPTVTKDLEPLPVRTGNAIRRVLVTAGIIGTLTVGAVALPATASAAERPAGLTTSRMMTSFCPFGTHGGPGGGCRGGSVNDNARANAAARDTAEMYRDAGECAGRAIGKSVLRNKKRPSFGTVALGTIRPGIKCGRSKGY